MKLIDRIRSLLLVLTVAGSTMVACRAKQTPITPELLAGTYSYVSMDPERRSTDYDLNRLVLQSDGRYDLVEGGTTKAVSEKRGIWRIEPGTPPDRVDVVLDHSGYPIEVTGNEVRLLIDLDVGIWWVKFK